MNSKVSDKDKKDWENFLQSNKKLPNKDINLKKRENKKSLSFDLHGYSLDNANKKIVDLIHQAYDNEIRRLIIVTGKGLHSQNEKNPYVSKELGILRYAVPEHIKNNNQLMRMINSMEEASIEDGGSGAFYINLKKKSIK